MCCFLFFKQKTAYEMRISDWSSDVCSSDLLEAVLGFGRSAHLHRRHALENDRAVVIEIIDEETRLRSFSAQLDEIPDIGLITLEAVDVLGGKSDVEPPDVQRDRKRVRVGNEGVSTGRSRWPPYN